MGVKWLGHRVDSRIVFLRVGEHLGSLAKTLWVSPPTSVKEAVKEARAQSRCLPYGSHVSAGLGPVLSTSVQLLGGRQRAHVRIWGQEEPRAALRVQLGNTVHFYLSHWKMMIS